MAVTRYFTSHSFGHTSAIDLFTNIMEALSAVDGTTVIQLSIVRSNVNWNLFEMICTDRINKGLPPLINFGSWSLHIVHGAFQTGCENTNWGLKAIM